MGIDDTPSLESLFDEAHQLHGAQRESFVAAACGDDAELRARLEALLAAHDVADSFLEETPALTLPTQERDGGPGFESPGDAIGPYTLIELIGEGGFGNVYLAEQSRPVGRRVALKIIKLGMDTKQVIARFNAERQALAMMDHPNIARVFDAGATETGRPYFVMEHVDGVPITQYCDEQHLTLYERLRLFVEVCHAVQHAHQKGIIHRDLKPSNVLVVAGTVKVIDFGIAKATNAKLTEQTIFTELHQFIGTPEYMSPEQAASESDIDTRTDIYSLGVLLYELLTGTTPFEARQLRSAAYDEIRRIIREEEPPKPSTRLSALGDRSATVAAQRRTLPTKMSSAVRGDLDWIVMKAMEKDRSRRYSSATEFAADIERHVRNEPVAAGPPSAAYRVRKFVRRNRAAVTTGATVALALVAATIVSVRFGISEARQADIAALNEERAIEQAERAEREAEQARAARAEAEQRAAEVQKVADFQASQLSGIDIVAMGRRLREDVLNRSRQKALNAGAAVEEADARVADLERRLADVNFIDVARRSLRDNIFDRSQRAIEEQFADEPLLKARLLQTLSDTLRNLGLPDEAYSAQAQTVEIHRAVLGDTDPTTLRSISSLGLIRRAQGKFMESETLLLEALAGRRAALGNSHRETMTNVSQLGILYERWGRLDLAERYFGEALELRRKRYGEKHPTTAIAFKNMSLLYQHLRDLEKAEEFARLAFNVRVELYGEDDPRVTSFMHRLASILRQRGRYDEAEQLYRRRIEIDARAVGEDRSGLLTSKTGLAMTLAAKGDLVEAEQLWLEALIPMREVVKEHPWRYSAEVGYARFLASQSRFAEAEPLLFDVCNTIADDVEKSVSLRRNSLRDLIALYEAWHASEPAAGHDAKASRWRERLAQMERDSLNEPTIEEATREEDS